MAPEIFALSAVVLLIVINAVFVAAEFALVRVRAHRIAAILDDPGATPRERRRAAAAMKLIENMSASLSACQVGITLASIAIGFCGEPVLGGMIEHLIGESLPHTATVIIAILVSYLIITFSHITVGEQVPKMYAISVAEPTLLALARPFVIICRLLRPFVIVLDRTSNAMLRPLNVNVDGHDHGPQSSEDLQAIIAQSHIGGVLDAGEATMISGVFDLHEQHARDAMTPLPRLTVVARDAPISDALGLVVESGHTRLLVSDPDAQDMIGGTVHVADLLREQTQDPDATVHAVARDAFIVPESRPLDDLLADMRAARHHMAVVADEYGRAVGVITVEDIIEEIVGEITDETDPDGEHPVTWIADGCWDVDGAASLTDLADHGIHLPDDTEAFSTIAGLVFDRLGQLPEEGTEVRINGFVARVQSVSGSRIVRIRITEV